MSKARELAELGAVYDSGALSNRNIIINGAMNVSQRGDYSSATSLTDDTYFLDRWVSDLATVSATIQNVSNGYLSKSKTQKLAATSSATGRIVSIQKIEVSSYMLGVQLTASAQVKSNSSNARLFLVDNTNGTVLGVQAHTGGGAFEKLTVSGTPPTTCTDLRVYVAIRSAAQANVAITSGDFFEFTEVQLELGSEATPFEHRSFGDELARCQRYAFYTGHHDSSAYEKMGLGTNANTTQSFIIIHFPVTMRTQPTLTTTGTAGDYGVYHQGDIQCSAVPVLNTNSSTNAGAATFTVASGLTAGGATIGQEHNGSNAYLIWDAEL
jgi:hypothetical protein